LVADAESGKLDPVIGRDQEIRRCIQVLSRRTKNNPVLIGEPVIIFFFFEINKLFLLVNRVLVKPLLLKV
jgi:hypothetical protein